MRGNSVRKQILGSVIAIASLIGGMVAPAYGVQPSRSSQTQKGAEANLIQTMQSKGTLEPAQAPTMAAGLIVRLANNSSGEKLNSEAGVEALIEKRIATVEGQSNLTLGTVESSDKIVGRTFAVTLEESIPLEDLSGLLRNVRGVRGIAKVEPDVIFTLDRAPLGSPISNSRQTQAAWGLDRIDQKALPLSGNYDYDSDGKGVLVYVLDTGVRASHADFEGRVLPGRDFVLDGNAADTDCQGHGTHVAGTVAGKLYGVAKKATIVPVRVLDCGGEGQSSWILDALEWIEEDVARHGKPSVVNMSLGAFEFQDSYTLAELTIERLVASGVPVVVASGNGIYVESIGQNLGVNACYVTPARVPGAITVNASNRDDRDAMFSNYGECTDIYAPGVGITSAGIGSDNSSVAYDGTSMAAPHVAGVIARLLSDGTPGTANFERILSSANPGVIRCLLYTSDAADE